MSSEERRTVTVTTGVLLLASLVRVGWETRTMPPILPPEPVPAALLEATRLEMERAERMRTPLAPGERVDPNRAPDVELARLPGIGPALAARIVEDREGRGPFLAPSDLLRVSGIGPAILARVEDVLDLSNPPGPTLPSAAPGMVPPAGGGTLSASTSGSDRSPVATGKMDLNRAGPDELQQLPGIGPALADRIVEYRGRTGGFRRPEELLEVPGIGPTTLERLLPLVRVGG